MDEVTLHDDSLVKAIDDLINHVHEIFKKLFLKDESILEPINNLLERWCEFTTRVVQTSENLTHAQLTYWQDYLLLCQELQLKLANHEKLSQANVPHDLLQLDEHRNKIFLGFVEKYHFLLSQHLHLVIKDLYVHEANGAQKIAFYDNYVMQIFSLIDFIKANPEIFSQSIA